MLDDPRIFITGANGQLGTALRRKYPRARYTDIAELDITDTVSVANYDWAAVDVLINAAAYTSIDDAETATGRAMAWAVNAAAVANLADATRNHHITLVHISSDYVFDGTRPVHGEEEPFSPLSAYGSSKAAGDIAVSVTPKHYIVRTSWVIGEGNNFVRNMMNSAEKNISPSVVHDQIGRLTFTPELVRAIDHLLKVQAPYGVYNVTNDGPSASWAEICRQIFNSLGRIDLYVSKTTTAEYYLGRSPLAARPLQSILGMHKIHATGFESMDWREALKEYIKRERTANIYGGSSDL